MNVKERNLGLPQDGDHELTSEMLTWGKLNEIFSHEIHEERDFVRFYLSEK